MNPTIYAIEKLAEGEYKNPSGLKPGVVLKLHQQRATEQIIKNNGTLILGWATGTGKTGGAVAAVERLRDAGRARRALVIVPAALRQNFEIEGVKKFTKRSVQVLGSAAGDGIMWRKAKADKDYTVVSYELFRLHPEEIFNLVKPDTMVFDEIHRTNDPGSRTFNAAKILRPFVRNFVGLTGSIVENRPEEIAPIVDLATGGRHPLSRPEAVRRYLVEVGKAPGLSGALTKPVEAVRRPWEIRALLSPLVDFVSTEDVAPGAMPKKVTEVVRVEMSPEQRKLYGFALGKVDPVTAYKIRNNLPLGAKEMRHVFGRIIQARQASNTTSTLTKTPPEEAAFKTPKSRQMIEDAVTHLRETRDGQVVMYSNLVRGGVDVLSAGLKALRVPHRIFIGKGTREGFPEMTEASRQKSVEDFNKRKVRVLLLSGAGAEGLNLPNTTMFQSLDGHFNPERVLQAEARGRRLGGLAHRPPEQRAVVVKRYQSVVPRSFFQKLFRRTKETSVDEWIHETAARKHILGEAFKAAIRGQPLMKHFKYISRRRHPVTGEWVYTYPNQPASAFATPAFRLGATREEPKPLAPPSSL